MPEKLVVETRCPVCDGVKTVIVRVEGLVALIDIEVKCDHCHGTGVINSPACIVCSGSGLEPK